MGKSVNGLLQEFFKGSDSNITMENYRNIVGDVCGSSLVNTLFTFVTEELNEYSGKENIDYLLKCIEFILIVLENNTDINRKSIRKKICRTIEKVSRVKEEKNISDMTKSYRDLGKIEQRLLELDQFTLNKETMQYKVLEYIIDDCKNIEYLEQTFNHLHNSVNVVDKNGKSLFYNIIKKYINSLEDCKSNKELILYYNNIILLMKNQEYFILKDNEKRECIQLIHNAIDKIHSREKDCQQKKELLTSMRDVVLSDSLKIVGIDELTSKYNISIGYNNSLIDELGMYPTDVSKNNYPDRVYIKDYIITIDSPYAFEIDDGLSAKKLANGNYLLGVHIASPLSYIPFNSSIIKEAIERTSSIYLPRSIESQNSDMASSKIIPMFPQVFSSNTASLLENQYRFAKSYYFEIDKEGNVVDSKFLKTIVKSNKRCTFDEVNSIINAGIDNTELEKTVRLLDEITYLLDEKNKEKNLYLDYKSKKIDASNNKVGNSRAEKIINRTMMLTGNNVAEYFADNGYPTLYRTHIIEKDDIIKLEEEMSKISNKHDKEKFDKLYQVLMGIYPKAKYDMSGPHEGLGLEHHCHCTSPLRRAPDLVVERSLDVCYFTQPTDKQLYELENIIKESKSIINSKNHDIEMFLEEFYNRRKCNVYTKKCKSRK